VVAVSPAASRAAEGTEVLYLGDSPQYHARDAGPPPASVAGAGFHDERTEIMSENTYSQDLALLRDRVEVLELTGGGSRVAVAPAYQGRVMTSTLAGGEASFGWLNAEFIAAGREDAVFSNYGGEDRFWLGPEGGQFGLWFRQGEPFDLDHWRTPEGFNAGAFGVTSRDGTSVTMARQFAVTNGAGTVFQCAVERTVRLLDRARAGELLKADMPEDVRMVAFESENVLANADDAAWTRDGGLLSIWILGQFKPLLRGKVVVPFREGSEADFGVKATTDYFGEIPPERCRVEADRVLFACDGRFRSKIGISPRRSKGVLGSYDPDAAVLTIVQFSQPLTAGELPYVNSRWEIQEDPFAGDAINSYNDGEAEPGAGQLGPFYEMETSSPAAVLEPASALTHVHRTLHFTGEADGLNALAGKVLGIDLREVET
jgi:hypothetical protein